MDDFKKGLSNIELKKNSNSEKHIEIIFNQYKDHVNKLNLSEMVDDMNFFTFDNNLKINDYLRDVNKISKTGTF